MFWNEIFSLVVNHSLIRLLLASVAADNLVLEQQDIKTTFLHGELEVKGFVASGLEDKVCLLKRSLYGLKQSPRQWYKLFDSFIIGQQYSSSAHEIYVF